MLAAGATAQYAVAGRPGRRIADPPAPWWAPTATPGEGVRPGPTVFPPGGMPRWWPAPSPASPSLSPRPPPPGPGPQRHPRADHRVGRPHPSDPDATQAVGIPPAGEDPDATTTIPETAPDPTREMPRRAD
jgi:hypothetical protein